MFRHVLSQSFLFYFFFQAEDGIRDHCVTGVQTCALPISTVSGAFADSVLPRQACEVVDINKLSHIVFNLPFGGNHCPESANGVFGVDRKSVV